MVFSDSIFLFVFFPIVLTIYYLLHITIRNYLVKNIFLFFVSIFFYAWGNFSFLPVILLSIIINYTAGRILGNAIDKKRKKIFLFVALAMNLGILFHYKYQVFVLSNIQNLLHTEWRLQSIALPIGISFFTFQGMSYIIDVYRGKVDVQKSFIALGLYISFFPQLIAGPIVRYETIEQQIKSRNENINLFSSGMMRFVVGLGKKVLIANNMAVAADYVFNGMANSSAVLTYWLGALAYTLQIYFDFSGYSDMAIGLGKMFGFEFEENFRYPYMASNITDFWRRWHISLSSWFRDYVYIPMGGNRCSESRHIWNLFIVWLLTGIWHGANWTFILWGMVYFVLLTIEKYGIKPWKWENKIIKFCYRLFTLFIVMVAWIIFRSENIHEAKIFIAMMFGIGASTVIDMAAVTIMHEFGMFFLIAVIASYPVAGIVEKFMGKRKFYAVCKTGWYVIVLVLSMIFVINGTYNPFIYFNF